MSRYWCEVSIPAGGYAKTKENLFDFLESEDFPATYSEINKTIEDVIIQLTIFKKITLLNIFNKKD